MMSSEKRRGTRVAAVAAVLTLCCAAVPARAHELSAGAQLREASLAQHRHEFTAALHLLAELLEREPHNDQAWLMRAAILQVQGDYAASRSACRSLGNPVTHLVRSACLAAATGGGAESTRAALELEWALRPAAADSPQVRAWAFGILAERYVLLGDHGRAEAAMRAGLSTLPGDVYLTAALADLLLGQGKAEQALALLPAGDLPVELRLRRARAQLAQDQGGAEVAAIADELERLHRQEGHTHARTEAYYLLHVKRDPTAALPVAAANFQDQREPIDRSLLIEAAHAIDMPEAGEPVQEWLASNGFQAEP